MERQTKGKQKAKIRTDSKTTEQQKGVILTGIRTCYKASVNKTVHCCHVHRQRNLWNRRENLKIGLSSYNNVIYLKRWHFKKAEKGSSASSGGGLQHSGQLFE